MNWLNDGSNLFPLKAFSVTQIYWKKCLKFSCVLGIFISYTVYILVDILRQTSITFQAILKVFLSDIWHKFWERKLTTPFHMYVELPFKPISYKEDQGPHIFNKFPAGVRTTWVWQTDRTIDIKSVLTRFCYTNQRLKNEGSGGFLGSQRRPHGEVQLTMKKILCYFICLNLVINQLLLWDFWGFLQLLKAPLNRKVYCN